MNVHPPNNSAVNTGKTGGSMFSLKEIGEDRFVYRCHECGWESEVMTKQEAIEYSRSHECAPNAEPLLRTDHS